MSYREETHHAGDLGHVGRAAANANGEDDAVDGEHVVLVAAPDRDLPLALVRARRLALGADDLVECSQTGLLHLVLPDVLWAEISIARDKDHLWLQYYILMPFS